MVAELLEVVQNLKAELDELKEQKETKSVTAEINPFMGDLSSKSKYSLLEKDNPKTQYTLI